jgi:O-acetyl-ADP-ribose deacetylase (regulator of RNase III)
MSLLLLGVTGTLIVLGIGLQIWSSAPRRAGRQYALQLPSIFLYSLAGALFLFSLFPDSITDGRALGFSLGGAAGFVAFFMLASFGWLSQTRKRDEITAELAGARAELDQMRKELALEKATDRLPKALQRFIRHDVPLHSDRRHRVGIATGNLANVTGIDVWVNTENTYMEMARPSEPTISGTIRYHGSKRDDYGHIVDDSIYEQLRERIARRTTVAPCTVLTTGPGELAASHQVKRVIHVASVEGEPGAGYRQVLDVGRCMRNVLAEIDRLNAAGEDLRTAVVPLFGTGVASANLRQTVEAMVGATIDYFRSHRTARLQTVYLLAFTDVHEATCRLVLDLEPQLVSEAPAA